MRRKGGAAGLQGLTGERKKLYLMRSALTKATAKDNLGGTPKTGGYRPKPITLAKMPWNEPEGN